MTTDNIIPTQFLDELKGRYFSYAMSTITSRSLPDVRDGLKPVHRRIIYAMLMLKLNKGHVGFKKCARVVGDVVGKYHPHGDIAVYDALVRMAQTFAMRYPIVEGQGNFGSIDGDSQAAMRYTEARLTDYAEILLAGIDEDSVDFRPNYDDSEREPVVLPVALPNILANGSEGIAVGMATYIPPHNLVEICDALRLTLKDKDISIEKLLEVFIGPDFPTGGLIVQDAKSIFEIYSTGKGSLRLRSKWHVEEIDGCKGYKIIVTQIPYQVQKSNVIKAMADLYNDKKLPFISIFQDLSAEDIRIVITPAEKSIPAEAIMEQLFSMTELEVKIHINMNALDEGLRPKVMNLKDILLAFIDHRAICITRMMQFRLSHVNSRLQVLKALLVVFGNIDRIVHIIKENDEPKPILMNEFKFDEEQVEAVLNLRLRALRKLEYEKLVAEELENLAQKASIEEILNSKDRLLKYIYDEISNIRKKLLHDKHCLRMTEFVEPIKYTDKSLIIKEKEEPIEELTLSYSEMGWIKVLSAKAASGFAYKTGDVQKHIINLTSADCVLFMSKNGKLYNLSMRNINKNRVQYGEHVKMLLDMDDDDEIICVARLELDKIILVVTEEGRGFRLLMSNNRIRPDSKPLLLRKGMRIVLCQVLDEGHDMLALLGQNRNLLIVKIDDVVVAEKGAGMLLQRYKTGKLLSAVVFSSSIGLKWEGGSLKNYKLWVNKPGVSGKVALHKLWV